MTANFQGSLKQVFNQFKPYKTLDYNSYVKESQWMVNINIESNASSFKDFDKKSCFEKGFHRSCTPNMWLKQVMHTKYVTQHIERCQLSVATCTS